MYLVSLLGGKALHMDKFEISDAENEYRLHLRNEALSNPERFEEHMKVLAEKAQEGFEKSGRGVLVLVDDGKDGVQAFIPSEVADMQFGPEVSDLCRNYKPAVEWILVGITNGRTFPIVMPLNS